MMDCIIREKAYLGEGLWDVNAVFTDEGGTRSGPHRVEAPEAADDAALAAAVAALYA
jgi:hypothetical protein